MITEYSRNSGFARLSRSRTPSVRYLNYIESMTIRNQLKIKPSQVNRVIQNEKAATLCACREKFYPRIEWRNLLPRRAERRALVRLVCGSKRRRIGEKRKRIGEESTHLVGN